MINLLSSDLQAELRAAHLNVRLRSYLIVTSIVFVTIFLVFAAGVFLSHQQRIAAEEIIESNRSALSQYNTVRTNAESFHENLTIAKAILSQETLYSDLVINVTRTLPPNAVLTNLELDEETMRQPMTISARVASQQSAVNLKNTLESSTIFSDVSLINVQQETTESISEIYRNYPVVVILQASLDKDAAKGDQ